ARLVGELGWQQVEPDVWSVPRASGPALARISVPPHSLREVLRGLPASATWWAWPGFGVAHWAGDLDAERVGMARTRAERAGGSLILLRAPLELKRQVGAWGTRPATVEWMGRLRDAFDPKRTISPGRYLVE